MWFVRIVVRERLGHAFLGSQIMTDGARVRQIITNGLTNAIKYAPPSRYGPVRVLCRATAPAPGVAGGVLTIEVMDGGPGLQQPESDVFADFGASVPPTRTGAVGSSGLGLAICNRLARLLGGELHITGRPDGAAGARFVLTLPLAPVSAGPAETTGDGLAVVTLRVPSAASTAPLGAGGVERAVQPLSTVRVPLSATGAAASAAVAMGGAEPQRESDGTAAAAAPIPAALGLHVLLVDDSAGNRRVGSRMLAELGCTCVTASDGDEVRALLRLGCLCVMDMFPPMFLFRACAA